MALRDFLPFARKVTPPEPAGDPPDRAMTTVGWSENHLFGSGAFRKYNPDEIMGRRGFAIYRSMMKDEQVNAVVKFKRDAITSRDFYFAFDDDVDLSEEERQRRIGMFTSFVRQMKGSFTDALNMIMRAEWQGYSMTEKVFGGAEFEGRPWWGIERLLQRPFDSFFFHVDEHGNTDKITQEFQGRIQEIDREKFIHYVKNPDMDEHYGQSSLHEAYRAWWFKDKIIKMEAIFLERMGGGLVIATPDGDGFQARPGSQDYEAIQAVLNNIQTTTGILSPKGLKWDIHHPADTEAYQRAITSHNLAIAKALLVPNLLGVSEQGAHGSFAQSASQLEAFFWTLDADAKRLEEVLNEQLFRQLGEINFLDGIAPQMRFRPVSEKKAMEVIRLWKDLAQAGVLQITDEDEAWIRDMMDSPPPGEPRARPGSSSPEPEDDPDDPGPGETIAGADIQTLAAFRKRERVRMAAAMKRAEKRVAFAVIDRESENLAGEGVRKTDEAMSAVVADLTEKVETEGLGTDRGSVEAIGKLSVPGPLKQKLRNTLRVNLEKGWKLGQKHAQDETDKARQESFTANMDRLEDRASEFMKAKSFQMAGKLTEDTLAIAQNILTQGLKGSKTTKEMTDEIYYALGSKGIVTQGVVVENTGDSAEEVAEILGTSNAPARLETVVRTNLFEAVNESRYSFFTDPQLGGFVEALEYSSILDSRTTRVCEHMDGRTYERDDPVWNRWRPPNHFNCRSLLVPITATDTWDRSPDPSIEPQDGFG